MKNFISLLIAGTLGTFFIFQSSPKPESRQASAPRPLKYEQVNERALNQIKNYILAEKNQGQTLTAVQTTQIEGKTAFAEGMVQLFAFLKTNQVLYRYELNNSLKNYLDKMGQVKTDQVEVFNTKMNEVLDFHKNTVSRLNFNQTIKNNASTLIEGLKNPLKIKTITTSRIEENKLGKFLAKIENALQDLTIEKEIYLHTPEFITPNAPIIPIVALWTTLSLITFLFLRKKTVVNTEAEELVNPTFKRIMSEIDYPLVMVDQGLKIVWQNKKSEASPYELSTLQEIFKTNTAEEGEIKIDGKVYCVNVSELSYKSGRKNFLAQLKPKIASNKNLEHLIDYRDVSALIESHNPSVAFGDVNQSVAQLAIKLGYLFKVSGKFLDLNFNKNISDCFIESERLEGMLKEFIMGCHHIIKDDSEVSGIYLRTNETGNKFAVSCFLMNFRSDALESHPLTRDFLRRFSILEAKYAICNSAIEFRFKESPEFKGLDITMSFENRSELELIVNNMSANA